MGSKHIGLGFGIVGCLLGFVACTVNNASTPTTGGGGGNPDGSVTGEGGSSGNTEGGATGPGGAFHTVSGAQADERTTGIYCPTNAGCVVATTGDMTKPHLYAIDANTVNPTPLFTSDDALATTASILGTVEFTGLQKVGGKVVVLLDNAGEAFLSAAGDPLQASSWSAIVVGTRADSDTFGLNTQIGFGVSGANWIQMRNSFVFTAPAAPATGTSWTDVWSPGGVVQVPANLADLHTTDPTLCLSEVAYSNSPKPTQAAYVAADGAIVLYPAHGLNQSQQDDDSGVCISTDGGNRFHIAKFAGVAQGINGPTAMTCTSKDHCVAAGGMVFTDDSSYVYVSNNASQGATSTWTAATIPATTNNTLPFEIFFAPDAQNGWIVGSTGGGPLLWATADGGATWTDQTGSVASFTDRKLWSGFALDAAHVVIGGETGVILSNW